MLSHCSNEYTHVALEHHFCLVAADRGKIQEQTDTALSRLTLPSRENRTPVSYGFLTCGPQRLTGVLYHRAPRLPDKVETEKRENREGKERRPPPRKHRFSHHIFSHIAKKW